MKRKFYYWILVKIFAEVSTKGYPLKEASSITLFDAAKYYAGPNTIHGQL